MRLEGDDHVPAILRMTFGKSQHRVSPYLARIQIEAMSLFLMKQMFSDVTVQSYGEAVTIKVVLFSDLELSKNS